jgi:hypothetical protein
MGTLFCSEGVSKVYKANATRHVAFAVLLETMSEQWTNAISGHSQKAHTLLNYYCHMDGKHAGQHLAKMTGQVESQTQPEVLGLLSEDNRSDCAEEDSDWLVVDRGFSSTPINVGIPGSLAMREGGESHNVVHKYVP